MLKKIPEKGIYNRVLNKIVMDIKYVIGILISLITAIGILRNNKKVKLFFEKHEWADVILAICFIGFAIFLALYSNQQDKVTSMEGTLKPDSHVILFARADIYPSMQIGHSGVVLRAKDVKDLTKTLKKMLFGQDLIIRNDSNQLYVSANIRNRDGTVVTIKDNYWEVSSSEISLDRNYNNSALEVIDNYGDDVILQIHLLPDRVQIQGKLYNETGFGVAFCDGYAVNSEELNRTNSHWYDASFRYVNNFSKFDIKIKPIFKYPSRDFLGESAKNAERMPEPKQLKIYDV